MRHLDEISVELEGCIDKIMRFEIGRGEFASSKMQVLLDLKIQLKSLESEGKLIDKHDSFYQSFIYFTLHHISNHILRLIFALLLFLTCEG